MARLYFNYGVMSSSKTAQALMCRHNYLQKGFSVILLKSDIDTRDMENGKVVFKSRIGLSSPCTTFSKSQNLFDLVQQLCQFNNNHVVIVDEAHFCSTEQINQLKEVSVHIHVICYGLLTNFKTELFEGSKRLVEVSDVLTEIKTVCECGCNANINARFANGKLATEGKEIEIGDMQYKSMCYNCYIKLKNTLN